MTQNHDGGRLIHVLVVDDSAVVREVLKRILDASGDMKVSVAADPVIAWRKIRAKPPDVVVLDVELPQMDGLTFLDRLMDQCPLPVVICSSHVEEGNRAALDALERGAVGIVAKPQIGVRQFLLESTVALIDAVRAAARARLPKRRSKRPAKAATPAKHNGAQVATRAANKLRAVAPPRARPQVVAIGASTGGTEALRMLLSAMPRDAPGIAVVQHMPAGFTAAFAKRLDETCTMDVREARDGELVRSGLALIAPGGLHMRLRRVGWSYAVQIAEGELVGRHRPSVDVLFRSVAETAGRYALGVLLTGMGRDGAQGLAEMHAAGAATLAQDENSCVVFGMPKEAIALGAVDQVVSLRRMPASILDWRNSVQ